MWKAVGVLDPGVSHDNGTSGKTFLSETMVHVVRRDHADATVAVLPVVPLEEGSAVGSRVLD